MPPPVRPASTLFVFLDGVGLGPPGAANPFGSSALPAFARLAGGAAWTAEAPPVRTPTHVFLPIDATLGVAGLPQSGTGQAALFGGFNAAAQHGRHWGPYPPTTVRATLAQGSVYARLLRAGVAPERLAFANAFPARFFRYMEARGRWTATTMMARAAGVRLRTADDLARGEAVAADLTGARWPDPEAPVPALTAEASGRQLARMAGAHAFTLFEFWLTDKAGHAQDAALAAAVLGSLDRFLGALLDALDPATLLVVSSDHGNLEDLATRGHTLNPVPLVAWGPGAGAFADARDLTGVASLLVGLLTP